MTNRITAIQPGLARIRLARPGETLRRSQAGPAASSCTAGQANIEPVTDSRAGQHAAAKIESTLSLLAETNDQVVGCVEITLQADNTGLIHGLWIEPEQRDPTLALRMMSTALEEGKKLGCFNVVMDASTAAFAAIAVLLDAGIQSGALGDRSEDESAACRL